MTATTAHAERYLAVWNERDAATRHAGVTDLFGPDARYTDPITDAEGRDAIEATITAVRAQFPGSVFRLTGPADAHHDQVRFSWELGPDGQEAPVAGFDVITVDGEGRIRTVLGFLDRVPAAV